MPPKRKSSAFFAGPGRVLGGGEEKPAKRLRKTAREDDDADYAPLIDGKEEADNDADDMSTIDAPSIARKDSVETQGAVSILSQKRPRRNGRTRKVEKATEVDNTENADDASHASNDDSASKTEPEMPFGILRSGAGRGFFKYGEGKTWGAGQLEGDDQLKDEAQVEDGEN